MIKYQTRTMNIYSNAYILTVRLSSTILQPLKDKVIPVPICRNINLHDALNWVTRQTNDSFINSLIHFCWPSHKIFHKLDICAFVQILWNICSPDKLKDNSTNVPRYNNIWTLRSKVFVKLYCRKTVCITHHAVLDLQHFHPSVIFRNKSIFHVLSLL